ncbi:MAG: protein kinase [Chthoniobacterales bacterium]
MPPVTGASDTPFASENDPATCERCGASIRVADGVCLRCMLQAGVDSEEEASEEELQEGLLEADAIPDTSWRLGNYEILDEIGRGGMGVIYRARQRHSRRIVALKRVLSSHAGNYEWKERFRREAQAAASLDHPNILPIYEVSEGEDGLPFFSMKWATGGSLREAGPSLREDIRECVRLMAKVARAMDYAHKLGVLHRDLQPGNILLDSRGEPMVCDFGLAKWLNGSSDLTATLTTFGTPGYIAPEQADGPAADLQPAADIYSLGAVLFNLLANRPPFIGDNALSVIRQAATSDAPKLRAIMPGLHRDLETIVAHCLEREPDARYQTAGDLADDLERWIESRPIVARPVSITTRIWRGSRRHPAWLGAAAAGLLLGGIITSQWNGRSAIASGSALADTSIAVLPFENFSPDAGDTLVGDVMQDNILTSLAKVSHLRVISRSSVRDYKPNSPRNLAEIARTLGVRNLLEGSIHRSGEHFRINARLTDMKTGIQIWAEQFERNPMDIFAAQGEIAQAIADQLRARLSPAEKAAISQPPTTDPKTYNLYSDARELVDGAMATKDAAASLEKAVGLLDEATRRDPNFIGAYCELARAHETLFWNEMDQTPERLALAKEALDRAVKLGPDMGETHLARARYQYVAFRDYDGAQRELEMARRSLPNDSSLLVLQGLVSRRQGRWDIALRDLRRALEIDPRNPGVVRALADTLLEMRQYNAMEKVVKTALAAVPAQALVFYAKLADCYLARGDPKSAQAIIDRAPPNAGAAGYQAYYRFTTALYLRDYAAAEKAIAGTANIPDSFRGPFCPQVWFKGLIAHAQGDEAGATIAFREAQQLLLTAWGEHPRDPTRLSILAQIDAALGQKDLAITRAQEALAARPLVRDSVDAPMLSANLALVYAWSRDLDHAFQELEKIGRQPGGPSYGDLLLNPRWDCLRGDPRFAAILSSMRPQD